MASNQDLASTSLSSPTDDHRLSIARSTERSSPPTISSAFKRKTFMDLPVEMRLNIYKFVVSETIHVRVVRDEDKAPFCGPGKRHLHYVSPRLGILFVSKRIHYEVKQLIESTPIEFSGPFLHGIAPRNVFPVDVLSRVYKVAVTDMNIPLFLESDKPHPDSPWLQCLELPNLRTIHVESPLNGHSKRLHDFFGVHPHLKAWLRKEHKKCHSCNTTGFLPHFLAKYRDSESVQFTHKLIKERRMAIKIHLWIEIADGRIDSSTNTRFIERSRAVRSVSFPLCAPPKDRANELIDGRMG